MCGIGFQVTSRCSVHTVPCGCGLCPYIKIYSLLAIKWSTNSQSCRRRKGLPVPEELPQSLARRVHLETSVREIGQPLGECPDTMLDHACQTKSRTWNEDMKTELTTLTYLLGFVHFDRTLDFRLRRRYACIHHLYFDRCIPSELA